GAALSAAGSRVAHPARRRAGGAPCGAAAGARAGGSGRLAARRPAGIRAGGRMSAIQWARALEPALLFHVLAHLPLGRDAASLHDDTLPSRPWVQALLDAHAAAPGRLLVHALGLRHREGLE